MNPAAGTDAAGRPARDLLFLTLLAILLFGANIGGYDLWPADEPRFALVAREMLETGDLLVLHVNGEPYDEKPPLLFWAIAAVSAPFGDVSAAAARVPPVLAAIMTMLATWALARRLYGGRVALWSALVLMTAQRFWWQARTVQTDMVLTACLALALLAFWLWHESRRVSWLAAFYLAVAAAVYTKGPPGALFPFLLVVFYGWKRPEARKGAHWVIGFTAVALLIGLWLIPAYTAAAGSAKAAGGAIGANLYRQIIGRVFLGVSKAQWPWYYLVNLPVDWLPWSLFLPWTVPWVWRRRREDDRMRLLLSWTVPAFVVFSLIIGKRAIYLLPLAPALAILFARSVLGLMDGARATWRRRTGYAWAGMLLLLAIAGAGAAVWLTNEHPALVDAYRPGLVVLALVALAFFGDTLHRAIRTDLGNLHKLVASHFAGLALLAALLVFPLVNEFKSARGFCAPVRAVVQAGEDVRLYSVAFLREAYIFYSRQRIEPVFTDVLPMNAPEGMDFIDLALAQKRLRDDIAGAVEDTPVGPAGEVSEEDIAALREAIRRVVAEDDKVDAELAEAFQQTLTKAVGDFADTFDTGGPAYLYVKQEDWRWLMAFRPELRHWPVVDAEGVGSRDVLLVANGAGLRLLRETGAMPAEKGGI